MERKAKIIVNVLNWIKTNSAIIQSMPEKNKESFIEIFPDAIGLVFVLSTWASKSLSTTSLIIHPADLISIDPKKNKKTNFKKSWILPVKSKATVRPQIQGQNNSMYPIGLLNLVSSIRLLIFSIRIYL